MAWNSGEGATRAVREYVAGLEAANPTNTPPKSVSLTDPAARYTAAPGGPAFYAYSTNYLVDVDAGIIVDVEATPALRTDEVNATRTMIDRVQERFDLKPNRLIGDMAYGAAELLGWMVDEKQIEPHVPVWDKTQRDDDTLSSRPTNTAVRRAACCAANGAPSRTCVPTSPRPTPSSIDPAKPIARLAR
jgi:hypothetical protein